GRGAGRRAWWSRQTRVELHLLPRALPARTGAPAGGGGGTGGGVLPRGKTQVPRSPPRAGGRCSSPRLRRRPPPPRRRSAGARAAADVLPKFRALWRETVGLNVTFFLRPDGQGKQRSFELFVQEVWPALPR